MPVFKTPRTDLRAKYGIYLKVSFIFSLSILIAAFTFMPRPSVKEKITGPEPEEPTVKMIPTVQKEKPPILKPPKLVWAENDEISEDIILEDTEIDQNANLEEPPSLSDRPIMEEENIPFLWSEIMPEPIGGIASIKEKIKHTAIGIKAQIEGRVIIEVTIGKDGNPFDAIIVKGIGGGLDEVALNAVMQTKFKPGLQGDKPVNVRMVIPIKFELN